jgi:hypothetical protein
MRRGLRLLSVVFLAALVLVPLVESGHSHGDRDATRPCAVCVVAHHAPAATTSIAVQTVALAAAAPAVRSIVTVPAPVDRSPHSGRAPPSLPYISVS